MSVNGPTSTGFSYYCSQAAQAAKAYGGRVIALDRSNQELGETPEARLEGRHYQIGKAGCCFLGLALMTALFGFLSRSGNGCACIMVTISSVAMLVEVKELILQYLAHQKESQEVEMRAPPPLTEQQ